MNYKLIFPTYRNRYVFIKNALKQYASQQKVENALNLGTGEGDYDPMIAQYCTKITACDINPDDVEFAKNLNKDFKNIHYTVENALNLTFEAESFDMLVSCEVIEHVGKPALMMQEISRVLKKDGLALMTFPNLGFPFSYDPINRILSFFDKNKHIAQGAYAFGHDYLIDENEFRKWCSDNQLEILEEKGLGFYLTGLLEMYWTGIVQKIFKANSTNLSDAAAKKITFRPSLEEPKLAKITDFILGMDRILFKWSKASVGKAFILRKK